MLTRFVLEGVEVVYESPKYQSAVLFVRDMEASRRFYEGLLGQKVSMDFGANVGFVAGFALWQAERASEMVFGHPGDVSKPLGRENLELYFETEDLEATWARLAEVGTPVVHAIREQPWGQRAFRVADPDGHVVEFGEPMYVVITRFARAGMSAEAVAERTFMPIDIVTQVMQAAGR